MISFALLKSTAKKNWLLLVIFLLVLSMYTTVMISMYDPENMEYMASMLELFPDDMMRAMGFSGHITNLTSYLASWLYGLLMLGFPMVYCIILGNRLVVKMVDNSSIAYILATPNSRKKIIITLGIYALLSVAVLFGLIFAVGIFVSEMMLPGLLDISGFFRINLITMLVNMVVMMICFFFSSLFNETRRSIFLGAGIPIIFLLLNMLGGVSDEAKFLHNFSIYGFYDPIKVVANYDMWQINVLYVAIILVLFAGSVFVFSRKQLPI